MKLKTLTFTEGFRVGPRNKRSQAAVMVIPPGEAEGGPGNRHRGADQWLFVLEGRGQAIVKNRRHALKPGSLLLIERNEIHEVRNTSRKMLRTLNFYVPPAYRENGTPLARGRK